MVGPVDRKPPGGALATPGPRVTKAGAAYGRAVRKSLAEAVQDAGAHTMTHTQLISCLFAKKRETMGDETRLGPRFACLDNS